MGEGRTTLQGADPGTARDLGAASQPGIYTFVCVRVCVCACVCVWWQDLSPGSVEEAEEAEPDDEFKDAIEVNTSQNLIIHIFAHI